MKFDEYTISLLMLRPGSGAMSFGPARFPRSNAEARGD
jgi:hypothetical protein